MPSSEAAATKVHEPIVATSSPVLRRDWRPDGTLGDWHEILPAEAADMSRLVGGPVSLDHRLAAEAQVGVVERAYRRNGAIVADLRFGSSDLAQRHCLAPARRVSHGQLDAGSIHMRVVVDIGPENDGPGPGRTCGKASDRTRPRFPRS